MIISSGLDWLNWRKIANVVEDGGILHVEKQSFSLYGLANVTNFK